MKTCIKTVIFLAAAAGAAGAMAQKAGDNILAIGVASINPSASLGALSTSGAQPLATAFGAQTVGATAHVSSETTVSFGWLHMFTDNVASELTLGVPPKHTVDLATPNGAAKTHPAAATVKTLTPALLAKYLFNTPQSTFRPYLGLGVSRVSFNSLKPNMADPTVALLAGTSASMSSSWVPVYNAGVIYNINDRWSVSASVSYLPIKTTATFVGSGVTTRGDLKLNTTDYVVRAGYRF